jgi:hypothetical protein
MLLQIGKALEIPVFAVLGVDDFASPGVGVFAVAIAVACDANNFA